ncbi:hypothetical protein [Cytobacillus firmus]|uniref:hypothetical protein n=1 Tax=Cytobacillus firmus TaxID=1399 RepID=UPI0018CE9B44|nr:hypothetical protein [Cytobacillus firmus]MBG9548401.1 hypothetical protein [Cytobacillus firmus]MBG9604507.1 hypothetical protein [Cytobacillus firmus]MED1942121.1 hypothetical protein [Cytobacillus firmus]
MSKETEILIEKTSNILERDTSQEPLNSIIAGLVIKIEELSHEVMDLRIKQTEFKERANMQESTFVTLDKEDVQAAIADYLVKKGYQTEHVSYRGQASILGGNVLLQSAEAKVTKIPSKSEF